MARPLAASFFAARWARARRSATGTYSGKGDSSLRTDGERALARKSVLKETKGGKTFEGVENHCRFVGGVTIEDGTKLQFWNFVPSLNRRIFGTKLRF